MQDYTTIIADETFTVRIGYACEDATLTIPSSPFSDHDIRPFEPEYTHAWTGLGNLVTINSWLDCRPFVFTWKQQKDEGEIETLDTTIFTVDESTMTIKV